MKSAFSIALLLLAISGNCALAQRSNNSLAPGSTTPIYGSNPGYYPYGNPSPYVNPYYHPGMRPMYGNPYASQYYGAPVYGGPAYGAPVAGAGGYFKIGNFGGYWRAPSGYYYPWMAQPGIAFRNQPIVIVQDGNTNASKPPVSTMFTDIEKYLDESKEKSKIDATEYNRLNRRLKDITQKYYSNRSAQGGTMTEQDDDITRRDLDLLSAEIARTVR